MGQGASLLLPVMERTTSGMEVDKLLKAALEAIQCLPEDQRVGYAVTAAALNLQLIWTDDEREA